MISTAWDTTALIRTQMELREKIDLLRELTLHQESVREDEKLSIAREIHDVIGQSLTGAHLELTAMEEALESGEDLDVTKKIQDIKEFLQEILESSQNLATDLRPDMIDLMGLEATLKYYLPRAVKRAGLEWTLDVRLKEDELDPQVSLTAYRLIQESVTNAIRHSGATRIQVTLEARQSKLLGTVRDNGRGITEAEANHPQAWGLVGMRERLLGLGGLLEIQGVSGEGTTVRMVIPLRNPGKTP
jgi:signal transduction histidine kinase